MSIRVRARRQNFKQLMKIRDREIKRANKATVRALDRFGAVIRQDARRSIGSYAKPKRVKWETVDGRKVPIVTPASKPRSPGQPPRSRTGHEALSLRNIKYISDYQKARVQIGPWNTNGQRYGTKTVPDLQEFGGTITTRVVYLRGDLTKENIKRRKGQLTQTSSRVILHESKRGQPATFKIPKRPFMRPAFQKHKSKATKIWADYYKAQRRKT